MLMYSIAFQILLVVLYLLTQTSPSQNESSPITATHSNLSLFDSCGNEPNDIFDCLAVIIYCTFIVTLFSGFIICIILYHKFLLRLSMQNELRMMELHRLDIDDMNYE